MSIKQLVSLLLTLFVIFPLLLISIISYQNFKSVQTKAVVQNMQTAGVLQKQRIAEQIETRILNIMDIIEELGFAFDNEELGEEKIQYVRSKFLSKCKEEYVLGMALYDSEDKLATVVDNQNGAIVTHVSQTVPSMLNSPYISRVMTSESLASLKYFQIIVPFFSNNGEYIGSISEFVDVAVFGDLLRSAHIFKTESEFIIDSYGDVLTSDSMIYDEADKEKSFFDSFSYMKLRNEDSGIFSFDQNSRICCYQKIKNQNWYYLITVDKDEIILSISDLKRTMTFVFLAIAVGTTIFIVNFASKYGKRVKSFTKSIQNEVDMKNENAIASWMTKEVNELSDAIKDAIKSSIESKKATADMLADVVAYKKAIEVTSVLVFDASISKNKVLSCNNGAINFGGCSCDEFIESIADEGIHKAYINEIKSIFNCSNLSKSYWEGKKFISKECLYHSVEDAPYQWISFNAILFSSEVNEEIKSVLYIQNINERKEKELTAIEQSQVDALSGVYNKKATQDLINEYLYTYTGSCRAVFIIMDIDNFKSVNDTFGHIVGDDVISDVADRLKKQFRSYDVIGRIGGDEFVVFLKDIDDYDLINNIINNVIIAIHYPLEMDGKRLMISVSAGVAVYPEDGGSYNELYRRADSALYESKKAGKNRFSFYNGDNKINAHKPEEATENDPELKALYDEYLLCEEKEDKIKSAENILSYIGRKHNISRIYNIILDDSQKNFYTTLEWCNEGIPHNMLGKAMRSLEMNDEYTDYFNEENIFACRDVRQLESSYYSRLANEGVIAILQYSEIKDGRIVSCVGFDDCREKRYWSEELIKCLYLVKKLSEECY